MIVVEHVAGRVGMARCGSLAGGHGCDSRYPPGAPMGGGGTPHGYIRRTHREVDFLGGWGIIRIAPY